MARILTPNKEYSGVSASVRFVSGEGFTTDPHLIQWFTEHSYKVVPDAAEEVLALPNQDGQVDDIGSEDDFESLTKDQLQEIAKELGLEFNSKTNKADLIEMIKIAKDMEE